MGFSISLTDDDVAFATRLNELRKEHTTRHKPATRKDGDLVGCIAEVAGCKAWGLPYDVLGYDHGGGGDGGIDVILNGVTINIKSSADHPDSWLVKNLKADWFVFAFAEMPYTVHFLGRQHRDYIRELPLFKPVRRSRRVELADLIDIDRDDFVVTVPRVVRGTARAA